MMLLNLGCGHRIHPAWINIDYVKTEEGVLAYDLTRGIPFPDYAFDVVYHSHFLEHLSHTNAQQCLKECYRVLRPQGVLRVVVPDWENVVRLYFEALEQAAAGSAEWAENYEWLVLEMIDQMVRTSQGGEMRNHLFQKGIPNKKFVIERGGIEIRDMLAFASHQVRKASGKATFIQRLRHISRYPYYAREMLLRLLLGKEYQTLQIGRFRLSGETHQWIYDRYSLTRLLKICGFEEIMPRTAFESAIPQWPEFYLDIEPDGTIYKPNSLYMEARKPA